MDERMIDTIFWIVIGAGIVLTIFCFAMGIRDCKAYKKKQAEIGTPPAPAETVVKTITTKATVINQACRVSMAALQIPKTVKEFVIVFRTEEGEILKLNVPEMLYDGFQQGQIGTLTTVDGELYSFELD